MFELFCAHLAHIFFSFLFVFFFLGGTYKAGGEEQATTGENKNQEAFLKMPPYDIVSRMSRDIMGLL